MDVQFNLNRELKMRKGQGFTLIELVVVITIIGILATVAIPTFIMLLDDAHEANMDAVESTLRTAVIMWASDQLVTNGTFAYPPAATVTIAAMIAEGAIEDWSDNGAGVWTYALGNIGTLTYIQTGGGTDYTITKVY